MILLIFIFEIVFILVNAFEDWRTITIEGKYINHRVETIAIIVFMVFIWCVVAVFNWRLAIVGFITFWPLRWLLFDLSLNLMRGKPFDYLSEPGENASVLDTFLTKHKKYQYIIKSILLIAALIVDFLILKQ